jgi:dihydroflavonol-4-reductase
LITALITGATGFIGSQLVDELLKKDNKIKCFVRKNSNLKYLKDKPVDLVYGDYFDKNSLIAALKDVDYVYHVAGVTFARKKEDFYKGNVEATRTLIQTCYEVNPAIKRFVHVSSQAAVGPSKDKNNPIDETAECFPLTNYGKSKLEAEKIVTGYFDKMNCTIVRPPAVYGPRDVAIFEYFKTMNNRIQPLIGFGDKLVSLIHSYDLVQGIILAAESNISVSNIYFISSEKFYSWKEVGEITEKILSKKSFTIRIPHFAVYIVGAFAEFFSLFSSKPAILNLEKCSEITQSYWICSVDKAIRDLGFRESLTLEQGIQNTVEWYINNGWIK